MLSDRGNGNDDAFGTLCQCDRSVRTDFTVGYGTCHNPGEVPGVIAHEWGHGLDWNDGAPLGIPSEAPANIFAMLAGHTSCIGRGFSSSNCHVCGYACLDCTGSYEIDWD